MASVPGVNKWTRRSRLPAPEMGRTRASLRAFRTWHPAKLQNPLPFRSIERARQAFPFGVIDLWNTLPRDFFGRDFDIKYMQGFKVGVHRFLSEHIQ